MSRYKKYDVVIVPFPCTDSSKTKKRPAVVISDSSDYEKTGHSVCVMVTSSKNTPWPLDCAVTDLKIAGLPAPSTVRMKLFTIDDRLIQRKAGVLSKEDALNVSQRLSEVLGTTK